jgi:AcrR family transcriptional regulator
MSYNCDMNETMFKIADTAIRIFNQDPSAKLETVAEEAGVTSRTLYRYFKDRAVLLNFCRERMSVTCRAAMETAFKGSDDLLKQLELTLYAGIECGSKYAFFDKMNHLPEMQQVLVSKKDDGYDELQQRWLALIIELQQRKSVSTELSPAWIQQLFSAMVSTTLSAIQSGSIAPKDVKKFAWYSFSRSIGISENLKKPSKN